MTFEIPEKYLNTPEAIELLKIDAEFTQACADEIEAVKSKLWESSPSRLDELCRRTEQLQASLQIATAAFDSATGEPEPKALPPDLANAIALQFLGEERDHVTAVLAKTIAILHRRRIDDPRIGFGILKMAAGNALQVEHFAKDACVDYRDLIGICPMPSYTEVGGIRYGHGFWAAINFTWPCGRLTASSDGISMRVSLGRIWGRTFAFDRSQIKSIKKKRGLMNTGIIIEHSNNESPPFVLFWTFRYKALKAGLESRGYNVIENDV